VSRTPALVDADWLESRLGDPKVVIVEADERPALYRVSHVPGAHCVDWRTDLQDATTRDLPGNEAMRQLWRRLGIGRSSHVVLYGDKNNWYACFAYWVFRYYGLQRLSLLDGGRQTWINDKRPVTTDEPEPGVASRVPPPAPDPALRATWRTVLDTSDRAALIDVRTPAEYAGDLLTEPGYPEEAAQRGGHIPGAVSQPWDRATSVDGRFHPRDELRAIYGPHGVDDGRPIITYCRIGERSAHTWFVLHELLGVEDVRNYDGSWTEWGSMIGMPVKTGDEPGELPTRGAAASA
jgi:thiosulfate/3-mercaptopyruvate sulfurtransferase